MYRYGKACRFETIVKALRFTAPSQVLSTETSGRNLHASEINLNSELAVRSSKKSYSFLDRKCQFLCSTFRYPAVRFKYSWMKLTMEVSLSQGGSVTSIFYLHTLNELEELKKQDSLKLSNIKYVNHVGKKIKKDFQDTCIIFLK